MKIAWLLLFFFIQSTITPTDLTKYFKKPINKSSNHTMKGIDFIYMINLDQRPEKFKSCTKQLSYYDIHPYRFSAVNGWELSLETINDLGVKYDKTMPKDLLATCFLPQNKGTPLDEIMGIKERTYFHHHVEKGTIGIILSHLSVLYDAYKSKYDCIWVMEDDIEVIRDPRLISLFIYKLDALVGKKNWDILFTDKDTKDRNGNYVPCLSYAPRPNFTPKNPERFALREQISPDFMKIGARYGTYSMIVKRSAIKKILDFSNQYKLFLPYDMDFYLPNNIKIYTVTNDIVSTQPQAPSDNATQGYK